MQERIFTYIVYSYQKYISLIINSRVNSNQLGLFQNNQNSINDKVFSVRFKLSKLVKPNQYKELIENIDNLRKKEISIKWMDEKESLNQI